MLNRPRFVFLDIDNTLLDFEASAERASLAALAAWGIDPARFDYAVFTEVNNALWAALERGEISRERIHKTRWPLVFDRLGIEADGEAFEAAFLAAIPRCVVPVEGAQELLSYLSKKYPLYAASNAPHEQQIIRLKSAGFLSYFQDVFTSERLGAAKPSAEFFSRAFSFLDSAVPEECVMIGDSLAADVGGAQRFGLKTIWFNFKKEAALDFPVPDFTVETLSRIQTIL